MDFENYIAPDFSSISIEDLDVNFPQDARSLICKNIGGLGENISVVNDPIHFNSLLSGSVSSLISLVNLNDFSDCNLFLVKVNQNLPFGKLIFGSVETYENRKNTLLKSHPGWMGKALYGRDTFLRRILPKFPLTGKVYDWMTGGKGKLMSEVEATGRLYAAGFELIEEKEIESKLYFVAKKIGNPIKDAHPTYWPIVKLKRIGREGKEFTVYKLRTMYPYSEYLQDMVFQKNNLTEGGKFKDDFRISGFGKFLRKFWLDEIPMIWNFLNGDLKLVGVRPLSKQYFNLYHAQLKEKRTQFKPGLIPPFYADMPKTLEEIMESEMRYLEAYSNSPISTDFRYFFKIVNNILFKGARSK